MHRWIDPIAERTGPMTWVAVAVAPFALRDVEELRAVSRTDLGVATLSGLALAAHFAVWFESLAWTSVAASVTLVTTQPVFVAVGAALLLDERLIPRLVGGMAVALVGAACMSIGPLVAAPLRARGDGGGSGSGGVARRPPDPAPRAR